MARVGEMTASFIAGEDWEFTVGQLARMEKVTKDDVIRVAKDYFGGNYVAGYRIDEQHELPSIEKPQIDPVQIDPRRQSAFAKHVLELPYGEMEPVFVDPEKDYQIVERPGVKIYYSRNPLNDLFSFAINVEIGNQEDNTIAIATRLLDKSGAGELSAEDLKKEWYKLGCDYGVGAGDDESFISVSGLDENFAPAMRLLAKVVKEPTADAATLDELTNIILQQRADSEKDPGVIGAALGEYMRHGDESYYLRMLPSEKVKQVTVAELHDAIGKLLGYKRVITYTGSLPIEDVLAVIDETFPVTGELKDPPPYRFLRARQPEATEIFFFDKEMAQAQVRIEFPDGVFDESKDTGVQLYNSYFAGGMSGIVFQELREARALAYSASARYAQGGRANDENLMIGSIGCQADKTPEVVEAFLDLFDNLPESPERFREAINSIRNRYQTSTIGFRGVIGAVRSWEQLGLEVDPRKHRYESISNADLAQLMEFHASHIKGRPKLISIVGDASKIDMERLAKSGTITKISTDQIFVD